MFCAKTACLVILLATACASVTRISTAGDESRGGHIDPTGIRGTLLLTGASEASAETVQQFARLVKAESRVVLVTAKPNSPDTTRIRTALRQEFRRRTFVANVSKARAAAARLGWQLRRPAAPPLPEPWLGNATSSTTTLFAPAISAQTIQVDEVVITDGDASADRFAKQIAAAGAVWFSGAVGPRQSASVSKAVQTVLDAEGVVAATRNNLSQMVRRLPNFAPVPGPQEVAEYSIGLHVHHNATLLVRGRVMRLIGDGQVDFQLATSARRPARTITLNSKQPMADLVSLRRAARHRAGDDFPPAELQPPVVQNGTLIIIGGGRTPKGLMRKFVEMAGGKSARIVILPTAVPDPIPNQKGFAQYLKSAGAGHVDVLVQRTKDDVESDEFLNTLRKATGVLFGGGRQWRFVDAYAGTKAEPLLHDVLKRGGVIAGSSAGASIQAEFLARGNPLGNREIMVEGYERGLGFLPGVAVDQHFTQRKRQADMTRLIAKYPQFLGIGIDETTAIIVQKGIAKVVGQNQVCFYDSRKEAIDGKDYTSAFEGSEYDLVKRELIKVGQRPNAAKPAPIK